MMDDFIGRQHSSKVFRHNEPVFEHLAGLFGHRMPMPHYLFVSWSLLHLPTVAQHNGTKQNETGGRYEYRTRDLRIDNPLRFHCAKRP